MNQGKAWVISVDMGYGHQRAAYPLRGIASGGIITANSYDGIPLQDKKVWRNSRRFYEFISRFQRVPIVGEPLFEFYDRLQQIQSFYPRRDLSAPTYQVKQVTALIRKTKWGFDLINRLSKRPLPIVTTFFIPAFMAEYYQYPGDIYCVVTDSDISRAWVPENPGRSRIRYFAPTYRVVDRLRLYGVRSHNIVLTGFPLPEVNTGGTNLATLKRDCAHRLTNLDPSRRYYRQYSDVVLRHLGLTRFPDRQTHPLTLTFAVGGAGAQRELAVRILRSLSSKIHQHRISYVMVAGTNTEVASFFLVAVREAGLYHELRRHVTILSADSKDFYFDQFNRVLRRTDILWSKPSELCFYTALGIPLIMADPIGSQEQFNKRWIESVGAGTKQEDPDYADEWLFDWLESGWLAESAMEGYLEVPKFGTYNIERIVSHRSDQVLEVELPLPY